MLVSEGRLKPLSSGDYEILPEKVSPKLGGVSKVPKKQVYRYRQIPPEEKCEKCGELATEYVIQTSDGTVLRRCQTCFNQMKTMFTNVEFVEE